MAPCVGEWVEVRSKQEILTTLDARGRLNGLPFMPQMFQYCGKRFRVYKSAHKTCDTINGTGGRQLPDCVHLENLRCDGKAYGGCEAECLVFWHKKWLRPADGSAAETYMDGISPISTGTDPKSTSAGEAAVLAGTLAVDGRRGDGPRYSCQATDLLQFTKPLAWWDARQYAHDYATGNASISGLLLGAVYAGYYVLSRPGRPQLQPFRNFFQWAYDRFAAVRGATPFPRRPGMLPAGQLAPITNLNLQPGELVRVRPYREILATIDEHNKNRGLFFDAEMVPFCGRTFRVRSRVSQFVNEKSGKINYLRTPAVILEDVWCQSSYSGRRMHCPRSIYSWWREVWLERVTVAAPVRAERAADQPAEAAVEMR